MNAINYVYVGVSSLCWIVISDKISHMSLKYWSCDLNWDNIIVFWQYFKLWFDCANCGLLFTVPCVCLRIYHSFVYNSSFLCPKHMKVRTSSECLCQNIIYISGSLLQITKWWINLKSTYLKWRAVKPKAVIGEPSVVFNSSVVGCIRVLKLPSICW